MSFLTRWSRLKHKAVEEKKTEPAKAPDQQPAELPPVDSLTFESDFAAFLKADVEESVKRAALKKLLHDPRFNVMDGLDTYIDDYTKTDPIDPAIVRTLAHARYIFNPPATRVTAEGYGEDIPEEELRAARAAEAEAARGSDVAGQDAAVALPGVQTMDDAFPSIVQQQDDAARSSTAQTHVDCVPSTAQPQDDEMPATKPQSEAA
jgi:hypothetical protein